MELARPTNERGRVPAKAAGCAHPMEDVFRGQDFAALANTVRELGRLEGLIVQV